jgi:hypothetical protein
MKELTGGWRRLHKGEFHNLYSSTNAIRVIKWRKVGWAVHVVRKGDIRTAYKIRFRCRVLVNIVMDFRVP